MNDLQKIEKVGRKLKKQDSRKCILDAGKCGGWQPDASCEEINSVEKCE